MKRVCLRASPLASAVLCDRNSYVLRASAICARRAVAQWGGDRGGGVTMCELGREKTGAVRILGGLLRGTELRYKCRIGIEQKTGAREGGRGERQEKAATSTIVSRKGISFC